MNHPLYNYLSSSEVEIALLKADGKADEAEKRMEEAVAFLNKVAKTQGIEIEDFVIDLRTWIAAAVIRDGHIAIDASRDDWYDKVSQKTISAIPVKNFKIPFPSGSITVGGNIYLFTRDDTAMYLVLIKDDKNIDFDITTGELPDDSIIDQLLPVFVFKQDSDITVGEEITKNELSEEQTKEVYSILSALMYITMSKASVEEYGDTLQAKKVKSKGKKKKGIPKHTINVINVRQKIRKGNGFTHSYSKSDKTWIVRGHWRNQWYPKLNTHKPKWIDPFFKGKGKVTANKIYKL